MIWEYLVRAGLTAEQQGQEGYTKVQTEQGLQLGIKTIDKVSQGGTGVPAAAVPRGSAENDRGTFYRTEGRGGMIRILVRQDAGRAGAGRLV